MEGFAGKGWDDSAGCEKRWRRLGIERKDQEEGGRKNAEKKEFETRRRE